MRKGWVPPLQSILKSCRCFSCCHFLRESAFYKAKSSHPERPTGVEGPAGAFAVVFAFAVAFAPYGGSRGIHAPEETPAETGGFSRGLFLRKKHSCLKVKALAYLSRESLILRPSYLNIPTKLSCTPLSPGVASPIKQRQACNCALLPSGKPRPNHQGSHHEIPAN